MGGYWPEGFRLWVILLAMGLLDGLFILGSSWPGCNRPGVIGLMPHFSSPGTKLPIATPLF